MSNINPETLLSDQHLPIDQLSPLTQQSTHLFQQGRQDNNELEKEDSKKQDYCDQDGVPLTAAGLTRAMETNQGQPLTEIINISTTNPSHLFWVPASQHPELAPAEFEKYVTALRTTAIDKGKVRRRRSVLSVSFTAGEDGEILLTTNGDNKLNTSDDQEENGDDNGETGRQLALDALENKHQTPMSLIRSNSMKSLGELNVIDQHESSAQNQDNDQHNKLEVKARKDKLRRSMSLQLPGNNTDPGRIPDFLVFDRNSTTLDHSPVLVPRTNRPLSRRGARTKFQRTSSISASTMKLTNYSSPEERWPAYRHSDSIYTSLSPPLAGNGKKEIHEGNDDNGVGLESEGQPYQHHNLSDSALLFDEPDVDLDLTLPASTTGKSMQPITIANRPLNIHDSLNAEQIEDPPVKNAYSISPDLPITTPIQPHNRLEPSQASSSTKSPLRERKSSWSWSFWSDDKKIKNEQPSTLSSTPTSNHDIYQENNDGKLDATPPLPSNSTSTSTSKQRFGFSSLFSRKTSTTNSNTMTSTSSDTSKKASSAANDDCSANVPIIPPKDFQLNKINHQRRLPIHVERAVYRLSHVKLANPRRPLHEQVIISNFMFWYLTIISQHQKTSQNEVSPSSIPSQKDSPPSRHAPPRTPQQIVAASKKKKKRLTKKTSHQNPASQNGINKPLMHQRQYHPASPSLTSSNQKKHSPSSAAAPQMQDKSSWQHYVDGSSKQSSTGFVIPENYLRPSSESNLSDNGTHSDHNKHPPRKHRQYVRRNSSSSEEDDEEDDDDDEDEEDDDDDYIDTKSKGNKSQSRAKPNHALDPLHYSMSPASPSSPVPSSRHNSDPLATPKKTAIS